MGIFKRFEEELFRLDCRIDAMADVYHEQRMRGNDLKHKIDMLEENIKLLELQRDYTECIGCKVNINKAKLSGNIHGLMFYWNTMPYSVTWEKGKKVDGADFRTIEDVEKFLKHDLETHVKAFLYDNKGGKK